MVNYIIIQDLLESFNQSFSNGDCAIISQSEAILLESSTHLKRLYELDVCISLQFPVCFRFLKNGFFFVFLKMDFFGNLVKNS